MFVMRARHCTVNESDESPLLLLRLHTSRLRLEFGVSVTFTRYENMDVLGGLDLQRTLEECGRREPMRETNSSPLLLQVFFCEPFLQLNQRGTCKLFSVQFHSCVRRILPLSGSSKGFRFDFACLYASNILLHLGTALGQALVIKSTTSRRVLAHSQARSSMASNWVPGQALVNLQAFQDQDAYVDQYICANSTRSSGHPESSDGRSVRFP